MVHFRARKLRGNSVFDFSLRKAGLPRRYAPRNDGVVLEVLK